MKQTVYLVRKNGALEGVFSTEEKAVAFMRENRRNGQFWRIEPREVK